MKRFDEFYSLLNELQNDTGNSGDDGDYANHMRKFFINSFSNPVIFDNYFELYSNKMRELANRSGSDIDQLNKNLEVINKRRDAFISHLKKGDDEIWDATDGKIAALAKITNSAKSGFSFIKNVQHHGNNLFCHWKSRILKYQ